MNCNELIIGLIFGLCFLPLIGLRAILLSCLTSFLWALGGKHEKLWRRLGVPLIVAIFTNLWWSIPGAFGILSIGYGIPDVNDPVGSTLGGFWFKVCKGNSTMANLATRGTIYGALCLNYLIAIWLRN